MDTQKALEGLNNGRPINTIVFGSPNTCEEGAAYLDGLTGPTEKAADSVGEAESAADGSWIGPAHESYYENRDDLGSGFDDVSDMASTAASALRDFASGLREGLLHG